jgi:hypothetical protein
MKERLENTLVAVARRYAPQLVPPNWTKAGDYPRPLPELARALSNYNVAVILGDVPVPYTAEASVHIKLWADTYANLYQAIARVLFPSYTTCNTYFADEAWPPIILLHGAATPLIEALAGYIAPFVAARQGAGSSSDIELRGLMDIVLEELEGGDLPREEYQRLRDQTAGLVKDLLALHVRQMPLTPPAHPILGVAASNAPSSEAPSKPAPPQSLPEENPPPTAESGAQPGAPLFFERKPGGSKPRPPVPGLPGDDRDA